MGSSHIRTPVAAMDGVGHRRRRRHDRRLAHAPHAIGMGRIGHLDDDRVDHRQVERRGHAVVEVAGVLHVSLAVEHVLFVQRPADPLHGPPLHLAFDVAGMNRLAGILNGRVAQDRHLARVGIDLDVDDVRAEAVRRALRDRPWPGRRRGRPFAPACRPVRGT